MSSNQDDFNIKGLNTDIVLKSSDTSDKTEVVLLGNKSSIENQDKSCDKNSVPAYKEGLKQQVENKKADHEDDTKEEVLLDDLLKSKYEGRTIQLPDFAIVYSFLELFGVFLKLPYITIPELEQSLDSTKVFTGEEENGVLESLHIKLFRKLNKSPRFSILANFKPNKITKTVLKFAQMTELSFAWDLEQFGYHILTCAQKLQLFKTLCEIQFDENPRFKAVLLEAYKADQGASLRLSPFGYEQDGKTVWFHEDGDHNIQVYAGELEEADTWQVRAGNLEDLTEYISTLKQLSEVNPKDVAAEKLRLRNVAKQEEKEKRWIEREHQRQSLREEKNDKKRGRKTKIEIIETSESEEEDDGCCRCLANNQSDLVLLCDGCDAAYHTLCLRPPVESIPEGDWFCPFCLQLKLIDALETKLNQLNAKIKARERKSKRMVFYGINTANIMEKTSEDITTRRSGRGAKRIDYNFSEYDEMINKAVSNGKEDRELISSGRVSTRNPKQKRQRRKLNDLDSDNEDDYDSGDSSFSNYDSDQRGDVKNFIVTDELDEVEELHSTKYLRRSRRNKTTQKRSHKENGDSDGSYKSDSDGYSSKRSKRRLRQRKITRYDETMFSSEDEGFIKNKKDEEGEEWVGSDESNEASESEDLKSENSDSPKGRRVLIRKAKKKVNLCEDESEEIEDDYESGEQSKDDGDSEIEEKQEVLFQNEKKVDEKQCLETNSSGQKVFLNNDQVEPIKYSETKLIAKESPLKSSSFVKLLPEANSATVSEPVNAVEAKFSSPALDVLSSQINALRHPRERVRQGIKSKSPTSPKVSRDLYQQQPVQQATSFSKPSSLPLHTPESSFLPLHPREIYNKLLKNNPMEMPNPCPQKNSSGFINHQASISQNLSSGSVSAGHTTNFPEVTHSASKTLPHTVTFSTTSAQEMSPLQSPLHSSRLHFNNSFPNHYFSNSFDPSLIQSHRFPSPPGVLPTHGMTSAPYQINAGANSSMGFYPMRPTPFYPAEQEQFRQSPAYPNAHGSTEYPFIRPNVSTSNFYSPPYEFSDHVRPPVHIGVYPYSQLGGNHNISAHNVKQDREIKKQMKEQAKQEREIKKLEKLQEKERKKQKKTPSVQPVVDGKANMNFFRNMVISADDSNKEEDPNVRFQ